MKAKFNWKDVNWNKTTTEIAEEMGVALASVSIQRKRYAPETLNLKLRINQSEPAKFTLKELRAAKLDLYVNIGSERLNLRRLNNVKGETVVAVTLSDWMDAWRTKGMEVFNRAQE